METVAGLTPLPPAKSGGDNKELQDLRNKMKALCKIEAKKGAREHPRTNTAQSRRKVVDTSPLL